MRASGRDVGEPQHVLAQGNLDPTFAASITEGTGFVNESALQADGKIISVGSFYLANGIRAGNIARLNTDGTTDPSFNPLGTGADAPIQAVALQPDGKILIGGVFLHFNGQSVNRVARLNLDGSLDSSFNNTLTLIDQVFDIALQVDGKVLLGGAFSFSASLPNRILRLNSDGSVDASFNLAGTGVQGGPVYKILIQRDGKILVGGAFIGFNGTIVRNLIRLNGTGSIDPSFNLGTDTNGSIRNIFLEPDDKLLISGDFQRVANVNTDGVARLRQDGTLETTFNITDDINRVPIVYDLERQTDGKIVFGCSDCHGDGQAKVMRMNLNGTIDPTFAEVNLERWRVLDILAQPDGKLLLGGDFVVYGSHIRVRIVRTGSDGALDETFNAKVSTPGSVRAIRQQVDGKIIIGGDFEFVDGIRRTAVARLNIDGSLDSTFDIGRALDGDVLALLVEPGGTIIIGGSYRGNGAFDGAPLHRLNSDGSFNSAFGSNQAPSLSVAGVDRQSNGKIVVTGAILNGSLSVVAANRFNLDGTFDESFIRIAIPSGVGQAILVQPDDKIVIGGRFFPQGSFSRSGILRLNPDGSLNSGFSSSSPTVSSLAATPSGKIVAAGLDLRRYSSDGNRDLTFITGAGVDGGIRSVIVQSDEKVVIGGQFSNYDGRPANRLTRLQVDGSQDTTFDVGTGVSLNVSSLWLQPDSKLLVGGLIIDFNGALRLGMVRLVGSHASVSGRVTTPDGRGLRNATVVVTDSQGVRRTATTSSFGVYSVDNVVIGEAFIFGVLSKRYRFAPRNLQVNDDLANVDFVGLE